MLKKTYKISLCQFYTVIYCITHAFAWNDWEDEEEIYRRYLYGDKKRIGLVNMLNDEVKLKRSVEATLEYVWRIYDEIYVNDIDLAHMMKRGTIDIVHKFLEKFDLVQELGLQLREE